MVLSGFSADESLTLWAQAKDPRIKERWVRYLQVEADHHQYLTSLSCPLKTPSDELGCEELFAVENLNELLRHARHQIQVKWVGWKKLDSIFGRVSYLIVAPKGREDWPMIENAHGSP
jgi:hypothetical protein